VQIQLALLSEFPGAYGGPIANISANGPATCVESPSTRLAGSVNVTQPGAGLCDANNGLVPAGNYTLTQNAPDTTTFVRWEVYNANTGALISTSTSPSITLVLNGDVTIVAVYDVPGGPSPSPAATPR
jgi:hypothetical protein